MSLLVSAGALKDLQRSMLLWTTSQKQYHGAIKVSRRPRAVYSAIARHRPDDSSDHFQFILSVLLLSFFKGPLDLFEGIFVEDLNIDCAR